MYNAPRAATCRAKGSVVLWALDRHSFKKIMMQSTETKREKYSEFLGKVPILSTLIEYEKLTIADALVEETFMGGETLVTEGETGDRFYIVKTGDANVFVKDQEDGKSKKVATLKEGDYFGEIALLTSKPRQATVIADKTLSVLSLDRKTFNRVMGPLVDILSRNIGGYSQGLGRRNSNYGMPAPKI